MKITGYELLKADGGWETYHFLKVKTDEGLVGWAEYNENRGRLGLGGLILRLGEAAIGYDPRNLSALEAQLFALTRQTMGGMHAQAIAAIVNACLDIKAKALGVPVHELLGGAIRDRLPLYWSHCGMYRVRYDHIFGPVINRPMVRSLADIVDLGREVREAGFKALKTNMIVFEDGKARMHGPGTGRGPGHPELNLSSAMQKGFVELLEAFTEGAGPGIQLMLDLNLHFKPEGYKRLAHLSERFDMLWLEMDTFEPAQLAHVRNSTSTPIASLEAIHGRRNLRAYMEAHAVDSAIIDVEWNGMPEALRMAAMCDAYEVNCAAHNASGPLATLASAHFCAVIPNFRIMEFDGDEVPWRRSFLTNPYKVENGEFFLPSGPGWGAEIDEAAVRARPGKE